jgi:hypothetical protein
MAGAIVGLPEAPIEKILLKNVKLSGQTGLTIGYANVTGYSVEVHADQGEPVIKTAGANVDFH